MPSWLLPLAAASFAVLVLNVALLVQRRRAHPWRSPFLRDLRRWDGRLPEDID
jgi:hypothetical protein